VQILRKILGKVLRLFLPQRWMRILRDPVLLPGYYRKFAQDIEPLIDMAQNGWNKDPEYLMAMLRKYAHIIDKALERPDYEPGHSRQWYDAAKTTLNLLEKNYASDPTITWVKEKIQEYENDNAILNIRKIWAHIQLRRRLPYINAYNKRATFYKKFYSSTCGNRKDKPLLGSNKLGTFQL